MTDRPTPEQQLAECPHGMGAPSWCTICNGRNASETREADLQKRRVPFIWEAKFPGYCAVCREEIHLLEMIGRNVDGAYVCGNCAVVVPNE